MSVGSDLSAARAEAGMTLAQVAERTRIRSTVIAGIEADEFSLCGGDVYARGHIRSIAKVVGIDSEPLVAEFDRLHAPHGPSAVEVFEADSRVTTVDRRGPNWTAAMASVVVLLLLVAGFQLLRGGSGTPSTTTTRTSTPGASPSSSVVAQVPPSAAGVRMRLAIVGGRSWVSVTAGSRKVFEGVLSDGTTRSFTDTKQIKIIIGNAGVVHLLVNGVDLGTAGGNGQVVRLTFGPGDPTGQG
jgi:transcriptional regulator with XRE-family HTH domain